MTSHSTTGIVHLRVNGRPACNTGTRWASRVMTTTSSVLRVTCKSCLKIAGGKAPPCVDCEHNDPVCPDCPNPPVIR